MSEDTFILTNGSGGFCHIAAKPNSRYNGVFFRHGLQTFKVIDQLVINKPMIDTTNHLWAVTRSREDLTEQYVMPSDTKVLLYTLSATCDVELHFDCKEIFDNRVWGRAYTLTLEDDCLLIHFVKANDPRETNRQDEYSLWIAIAGDNLQFLPSQKWVEQKYAEDECRKSPPFSRWIYHAGTLKGSTLAISCELDKETALAGAKKAHRNRDALFKAEEERTTLYLPAVQLPDSEKNLAYQCAVHSLHALLINDGKNGMIAGIPWFLEAWPRDFAVTAHAFTLLGKPEIAKELLFKALNYDGPMKHADAKGWAFQRFFTLLEKNWLTQEEKDRVVKVLKDYLDSVPPSGIIKNGPLETWMDTTLAGVQDTREGERVEINALLTAARQLGLQLGVLEKGTEALEHFWNGNTLLDGTNDVTVRPNVFLAAYVSPDSLSKEQWESVFDNTLPKLWLDWGGLSSIAKDHSLFTAIHTGEDNVSYHRGDSWFWVNNIAAIVMHRVNPQKYEKYITDIFDASTRDILHFGASGWASEISSAEEQTSEGCPAQAWSCSTYVELVHEMFGL